MKKIFIAATSQNEGKTTVALGLILNLREYFPKIGFIKPIGQRYLLEQGFQVDEDSVLIEKVCKFTLPLKDTNPIAVERGFTEKYIDTPDPKSITSQILDSYSRISKTSDLVIIEGTGHAGVGSVFDHSNAKVAKLLDAKVIIVSAGGVGRPIDEVALNKALFDAEGADVLGVIVNKIIKTKYDKISSLVGKGLMRLGFQELGSIPFNPLLSAPTIAQIAEEMKLSFLVSQDFKNNLVEKIIIAAMEPHDAFRYIGRNTLMITPGDREDIILAAIESCSIPDTSSYSIAGILLTGGIVPNRNIINLLGKVKIPLLISDQDTYSVASMMGSLHVKLRATDYEKIALVKEMVCKYVDINRIISSI
ncbi:MAG: AAA family ATPase [Candidatus Omnitrophica bacterium]|nr:AAA family ATPase [Candidatus Omnitrophota bacterium]